MRVRGLCSNPVGYTFSFFLIKFIILLGTQTDRAVARVCQHQPSFLFGCGITKAIKYSKASWETPAVANSPYLPCGRCRRLVVRGGNDIIGVRSNSAVQRKLRSRLIICTTFVHMSLTSLKRLSVIIVDRSIAYFTL